MAPYLCCISKVQCNFFKPIKIDGHKIVSQRERLKNAYQLNMFLGKKKEEFKINITSFKDLMDYDH